MMRVYILISILVSSFLLGISAQAQPSYDKLSSKTKKSKKNKVRKKTAKKRFSAYFLASVFKGTEPFDVVYSSYSANLAYRLNKKTDITSSLAFSHAFEEYQERYTSQMEDVSVSINRELYRRRSGFRISARLTQALPTSITSRDATLLSTTIAGLTLMARGPLRSQWFWSNNVSYSAHRYDTADEAGTVQNSQVAHTTVIGASIPFLKKLSLELSGGRYTYWDYQSRQNALTFASLKLQAQFTKTFAISLIGKVKSQVLTNNSLFDHDNSNFGINISIGI